jgi:peptide deformylase
VATRPIVTYGDPVLREKTHPVEDINQDVKDLVADMIATLKQAEGLGLAAPQVGESKRIFITDLSALDLSEKMRVYINPEILETSGEIVLEEGCLSFPGIYQNISRPEKIKIRAMGIDGRQFELEISGMLARVVLHENDHLEGKLFIDYLSPISRTLLKGKLKKLAAAS